MAKSGVIFLHESAYPFTWSNHLSSRNCGTWLHSKILEKMLILKKITEKAIYSIGNSGLLPLCIQTGISAQRTYHVLNRWQITMIIMSKAPSSYRRWLYPIYSFSEEIMFTHQNLSWELKTKLSLQLLEVGTIQRYSFPHIITFYLLDSLFAAFCPFIRDHFRIQSDLWFSTQGDLHSELLQDFGLPLKFS